MKNILIICILLFLVACGEEPNILKAVQITPEQKEELAQAEEARKEAVELAAKELELQKKNEECFAELKELYEEALNKATWDALFDRSWKKLLNYDRERKKCNHKGIDDMEEELEDEIFSKKCRGISKFDSDIFSKEEKIEETRADIDDIENEIETKQDELDGLEKELDDETDSGRKDDIEDEIKELEDDIANLEEDLDQTRKDLRALGIEHDKAEDTKRDVENFCRKY